jgi:hypothetical protein
MTTMTQSKKLRLTLVGIYLLAVVVRLGPVIAAREMTIGLDDMFQYDMLARSLAAGEGFRWYGEKDLALVERYFPLDWIVKEYDPRGVLTSFRAPAYPFFLSIIYRIFGLEDRFFITRLVQVFLTASLAPMTFLLARRLFPQKQVIASISGILIALYPFLLVYPLAIATEVIFIPLVLGAVLLLLRAGDSHRWQHYLLAGALLGAAALTRSVVVAVLPVMMLWAWFLVKDKRGALILLAGVLVFTIPWTVRNSRLHGSFTFVENSMGYNLYLGYHPDTEGKFVFGPSLDLMPYLDDAQRDQLGTEKAIEFIRQAPERVPYLMLRKLGYFMGLERRVLTYFYSNNFLGYIPQPYFTIVFAVFTLPFVLLTLSSAVVLPGLKWDQAHLLVGGVFLVYLAPHLLILAEPRFHLTVVPFLAVYAAYCWVERQQVLAVLTARANWWRLALALILVALLLFNWGFELWSDAEKLQLLFGPQGNKTYFSY